MFFSVNAANALTGGCCLGCDQTAVDESEDTSEQTQEPPREGEAHCSRKESVKREASALVSWPLGPAEMTWYSRLPTVSTAI
jgi:hypothetical protein